jgi:hypothetical protein
MPSSIRLKASCEIDATMARQGKEGKGWEGGEGLGRKGKGKGHDIFIMGWDQTAGRGM